MLSDSHLGQFPLYHISTPGGMQNRVGKYLRRRSRIRPRKQDKRTIVTTFLTLEQGYSDQPAGNLVSTHAQSISTGLLRRSHLKASEDE